MPAAIPLHRPVPAHLVAPAARPRETDEQRRDRHLDLTRELTDLNMIAARDAAHRIATRDPDADPAETPAAHDPTLALARATRAVTMVINLENRIAAGETAAAPAVDDPRNLALRRLLHPLADAEPDPVRRRALRLRLNGDIDDALSADLDDDLCLADIGTVIARRNGRELDVTKVSDPHFFPISDPSCTNPNARLTPFASDAPPGFRERHPTPRGHPQNRP